LLQQLLPLLLLVHLLLLSQHPLLLHRHQYQQQQHQQVQHPLQPALLKQQVLYLLLLQVSLVISYQTMEHLPSG
jgi:hypothetical protein